MTEAGSSPTLNFHIKKLKVDKIQEQHERAVGDPFIERYNRQYGTNFKYSEPGQNPPDLIYRSGKKALPLEITAIYESDGYANLLWQNARGHSSAYPSQFIKREKLIEALETALRKKCSKRYSLDVLLILKIYPGFNTKEEFYPLIPRIRVPEKHPFKGIYLMGWFPITVDSAGGWHFWSLSQEEST